MTLIHSGHSDVLLVRNTSDTGDLCVSDQSPFKSCTKSGPGDAALEYRVTLTISC